MRTRKPCGNSWTAFEGEVNDAILENLPLESSQLPLTDAIAEGAIALFGETYGDTVRTIRIGSREPLSLELCGGTHVPETGIIGLFKITSEGSVAAGIRRIEALTGRAALELIQVRMQAVDRMAMLLGCSPDDLETRLAGLEEERRWGFEPSSAYRGLICGRRGGPGR